mgnify:FL=1
MYLLLFLILNNVMLFSCGKGSSENQLKYEAVKEGDQIFSPLSETDFTEEKAQEPPSLGKTKVSGRKKPVVVVGTKKEDLPIKEKLKTSVGITKKNIMVSAITVEGFPPTSLSLDNNVLTEQESLTVSHVVGNIKVSDPDTNDKFSFIISGKDRMYFYIEDGQLKISSPLDIRVFTSKTISIKVIDSYRNQYFSLFSHIVYS